MPPTPAVEDVYVYAGDILRKARMARGLSLREAGHGLVSPSHLCRIEHGDVRFYFHTFVALCAFLSVDPADVVTSVAQNNPTP